jgi:hypothetical protein
MDYANIVFSFRALGDSLLSESADWRRVERIAVYMSLALDSKLSTLLNFLARHTFPIFRDEAFAFLEIGTCRCRTPISPG